MGSQASPCCPKDAAARRRAGRSISVMDHRSAAIARSRGAAVATRNLDDFAACGLDVINPWLP
jgi:hypothetical protein